LRRPRTWTVDNLQDARLVNILFFYINIMGHLLEGRLAHMMGHSETASDKLAVVSTRVRVDSAILARFPAYRLRVVFALGLNNGPSDTGSVSLLHDAATERLSQVGDQSISADPRISTWRETYRQFGAKPSSYPCSVEALLRRAAKGGSAALPSINRLVDVYNAVSMRHVLPVGGEDLDQLAGDLVLRFASGHEFSDVIDQPEGGCSSPEPGEVIWADDLGVTCRRWNWRQGRRTRLTETTTNAYFIVEALAPTTREAELGAAVAELCTHLTTFGAGPHLQVTAFG
jgi:DNA/RNA-binding domain of Phe-tRNA-synthetase-like protein